MPLRKLRCRQALKAIFAMLVEKVTGACKKSNTTMLEIKVLFL
jgi:hypothetical protein